LPFQQLSQPLEVLLVSTGANPAFLVLPMRRNPFFGSPVHLLGSNLHLEGEPVLADHGRVQRLIPVRPGHGDKVFDASGHRRPGLMNSAECGIAVLD
jgi:hypothetical protein